MRTIRIKLYKFNELSKDAKTKAIDNLNDINVDHDWFKWMIEEKESELKELGYNDAKILFSGFASQGDGACFTCSNIDFREFMNGKYKDFATGLYCSITHSWRYYFATSTTVNLDMEDNIADDDFNEVEKAIEDERERIGNEIYKELETEYYYLTSEEAIKETIASN